jgi:hypothetical protein
LKKEYAELEIMCYSEDVLGKLIPKQPLDRLKYNPGISLEELKKKITKILTWRRGTAKKENPHLI